MGGQQNEILATAPPTAGPRARKGIKVLSVLPHLLSTPLLSSPHHPQILCLLPFLSFSISVSCISYSNSAGSPKPPRGLSSEQESTLELLFCFLEPGQMHGTCPTWHMPLPCSSDVFVAASRQGRVCLLHVAQQAHTVALP